MWVFSAMIISTHVAQYTHPMPLDVDKIIPGLEFWFGLMEEEKVYFICLVDTYTVMDTGKLRVYQWLITTHTHLVVYPIR